MGIKKEIVKKNQKKFITAVWSHYQAHKRLLPWRETDRPYAILVSEIMLQQTQVTRVLNKYQPFLKQFPSFASLARAPQSSVLAAWQGLGYNRRALALQRTAAIVSSQWRGKLPQSAKDLCALPGIGTATAGAIRAFAWNLPSVFIETNIRRAYLHHFFPRSRSVPDTAIMPLIEATLDRKRPREWYWALMDYGSYLGTTLSANPNIRSKHYTRQSAFQGSNRFLRGALLRLALKSSPLTLAKAASLLAAPPSRLRPLITQLEQEGFITIHCKRSFTFSINS